jgi:5-dehydro-4-deoxyglucarate dehydratase
MKPDEFRRRLEGVIAFPVTPFRKDLSLDLPGFRTNLGVILEHPFCALVAAGGTGEMYSLSPDEHRAVVRAAVEETRGRTAVIAGVGINQPLSVSMARAAAESGADAILALPPGYPNADEDGLLDYYASIGAATPLPLLVYSRDWVNPGPAQVEKLARIPTLVAWKDGQGDIRRYQQIIARVGDRLRWVGGVGDDAVASYYSIGIRCFTSSISAVAPKLALRLHELGSKGDTATLKSLMESTVLPLYALRGRRKGYEVSVMKSLLELRGLAGGPVRPPLVDVRPEDASGLRAILESWRAWL